MDIHAVDGFVDEKAVKEVLPKEKEDVVTLSLLVWVVTIPALDIFFSCNNEESFCRRKKNAENYGLEGFAKDNPATAASGTVVVKPAGDVPLSAKRAPLVR